MFSRWLTIRAANILSNVTIHWQISVKMSRIDYCRAHHAAFSEQHLVKNVTVKVSLEVADWHRLWSAGAQSIHLLIAWLMIRFLIVCEINSTFLVKYRKRNQEDWLLACYELYLEIRHCNCLELVMLDQFWAWSQGCPLSINLMFLFGDNF